MGFPRVKVHNHNLNKPVRYLGVYFARKNQLKLQECIAQTEISSMINMLDKKVVTMTHLMYIFNRVLYPRLIY